LTCYNTRYHCLPRSETKFLLWGATLAKAKRKDAI